MNKGIKISMVAGCLALCGGKASAGMIFSAWLDGHQEGLDSVKAKGVFGIKLNDAMDSAWVYGAFTNLTGPVTSAHFHPGLRGVSNPPSMPITTWIRGNSVSMVWTGIAKSTLDSLFRGLFYVNVHTAAHPNGEIRGQLELERDMQFTADIKGTSEGTPVTTAANGMGFFQLSPDDSTLTTWVVYSQPAEAEHDTITLAHFHIGPAGMNGDVAINLTADTSGGMISAHKLLSAPLNNITSVAFLDSLKKGSVYINFHSKSHGSGLMRGQLVPSQERVFAAKLIGSATGITGKGLGIFQLSSDNNTLSVKTAYAGLTGPVIAAHFHKGANIVVPLDSASISATGITAAINLSTVATAGFSKDQFIKDLLSGSVYLNVHTAAHTAGEISGTAMLPARSGRIFRLEGSQETPSVATKAFGAGLVTMDMDSANVRYTVVADSLDSTFTAAHFHKQVAGTAGSVVLDIGKTFTMNADSMTGLYAQGLWTARTDVTPFTKVLGSALLMDSLYINIHTARNKSGAIRGQLADVKAIPVGIAGPSLRASGLYSRPLLSMGGSAIRFQGAAGGSLRVKILALDGKIETRADLSVNASGITDALDLSGLRSGMYIAAWAEKGHRSSARFLRQ